MTDTRAALHSSGKDGWQSPPPVLAWLDLELGFYLDAAASPGAEAFPGRAFIGPDASPTGSLGVSWLEWMPRTFPAHRPPSAFLNSPYSKEAGAGEGIKAWHRKAWQESRRGIHVAVLAPPTIDRGWAHGGDDPAGGCAWLADEWRIFAFRLDFIDPETGEPATSNVVGSQVTIYRPHVPAGGWPGGPRISYVTREDLAPFAHVTREDLARR